MALNAMQITKTITTACFSLARNLSFKKGKRIHNQNLRRQQDFSQLSCYIRKEKLGNQDPMRNRKLIQQILPQLQGCIVNFASSKQEEFCR
jgi:hypothetical protein